MGTMLTSNPLLHHTERDSSARSPPPSHAGTAEVMFSYQWDSEPLLLPLEAMLCARNVSCWRDKHQLASGDDYSLKIRTAALRCVVMLICASPLYEASPNCLSELEMGTERVAKGDAVLIINVGPADYMPHSSAHEGMRALAQTSLWFDARGGAAPDVRGALWRAVAEALARSWRLVQYLGIGDRSVPQSDAPLLKERSICPPSFEVEQLTVFISGRTKSGLGGAVPLGWQFTWRSRTWGGEQGAIIKGREHYWAERGWDATVYCCLVNRSGRTMDRVELIFAPGEALCSVTAATQAGRPVAVPLGCIYPCCLGYLRLETSLGRVIEIGGLLSESASRTMPPLPLQGPRTRIFGFEGSTGWFMDNLCALVYELPP